MGDSRTLSQNLSSHDDDYDRSSNIENSSCPESSWTPYFVDFLMNGQRNNSTSSLSPNEYVDDDRSSSVVSDAATSAVKNSGTIKTDGQQSRTRLRFKQRRTDHKGAVVDDALEDTASSPVCSPKVCGLRKTMDSHAEQQDPPK